MPCSPISNCRCFDRRVGESFFLVLGFLFQAQGPQPCILALSGRPLLFDRLSEGRLGLCLTGEFAFGLCARRVTCLFAHCHTSSSFDAPYQSEDHMLTK